MKKLHTMCLTIMMVGTSTLINAQISGTGATIPNVPPSNLIGIGTTNPTGAALHLVTGSTPGMLPPVIKLDRNDATNQAGLLSVGISGNGFATGLGGGSAYFKLEDPYGNSANSDMGFSTNANAAQLVIKHSGNVGIGTSLPSAALHLFTGSNPGMLPPTFKLERNDATNQAGLLTVGISSNGFAAPLGGGSAYFKLEDPFGNSPNSDMGFSTNATTAQMVIKHSGNVGIGTITPTANLEVTSVLGTASTAIIGQGKATGVFGEARDMNVAQTEMGIASGWGEAIGVFGKGTYASNTGNGNTYGVAGSAAGANPLNNIGVFGEAKNANGFNSGVIGTVNTTTGIFNTGVAGQVTLNSSASWNRAIAGYAPVAPNHFAGYFDGKVAIVDGSQANNFVLTSDANGLATWKDVCSLPCFASSTTTDWHTNGNATVAGDFIGTTNANPFNVYTNNTQRMTIDSSGKMGLGTATPTGAALHLLTGSNPGMLPPAIKLDRNDVTNQAGLLTIGISGNGFATGLGGGSAFFKLEDPYGNSSNSDMGFSTNNVAAQMVIKHSGNVGIGTSNPLQKLHVQDGGILISGNTPGYGGPQLIFTDNHLTTPNGRWAIEYLSAAPSRPSMGGLNFWKPFPDAGGAGNYSLFLKDDGKIGMGVTDDSTDSKFCASALPNGYRLYVNGGILTTKVKVANYCSSSWADYVFAADYKLKPLSEVEAFIKENKHLPNVPSAIQIEKDGLDLADMQSKQMEKIEELTLYLIEMKKEIDLLKKENADLKLVSKN
jgi:hypothetical protein